MSDDCKIYVGHLHQRTRERDVRDEFERYGKILSMKMKNRFCFIDYEDSRDADEAIRDMDGRDFDGEKIIVERPKGREVRGKGTRPERSEYRIRVENIPPRVHWSELKDKFRKCGEVIFGDVHRDIGFLEFRYKEDMYRALDDMHRTEWHGDTIYIYRDYPPVPRRHERDNRNRRSPSRSRSRSPVRDRRNDKSRSKSRSRSPARDKRSPRLKSAERSRSPVREKSPIAKERTSRSPIRDDSPEERGRSRS